MVYGRWLEPVFVHQICVVVYGKRLERLAVAAKRCFVAREGSFDSPVPPEERFVARQEGIYVAVPPEGALVARQYDNMSVISKR